MINATINPFGLCPPLIGRPIQRGPELISIPGITGVTIPRNTTGSLVEFRWPQRLVLREMILIPQSASLADAAHLELYIQDVEGAVIFDGIGNAAEAQRVAAEQFQGQPPRRGLVGWTYVPQWAPFTRVVDPGDRWSFQVTNTYPSGSHDITPRLWFRIERPMQ
jgi:hypothetical protein